MASTKAIGDIGEQLAVEYLEEKGYEVLERNAKYCDCEADIICCCYVDRLGNVVKQNRKSPLKRLFGKRKSASYVKSGLLRVIVFCEVKTRTGGEYGEAVEAVTPYKMGRYVTLAKAYIARHFTANDDVRFDVIEVGDGGINHIENAFSENDARYPKRR